MTIKCNVCAKAPFINEFHAASSHTKAYHELVSKIHKQIEILQEEAKSSVADYRHGYSDQAALLVALLEDKEEK